MTWQEPPPALRPFYDASYEASIVLYEGRMRVTEAGIVGECDGQMYLSWRPTPKVRFRITGGDLSPFHLIGRDGELEVEPAVLALPEAVGTAAWTDEPPEGITWTSGGDMPPTRIGDGQVLQRLLIHVVNFGARPTHTHGWRLARHPRPNPLRPRRLETHRRARHHACARDPPH